MRPDRLFFLSPHLPAARTMLSVNNTRCISVLAYKSSMHVLTNQFACEPMLPSRAHNVDLLHSMFGVGAAYLPVHLQQRQVINCQPRLSMSGTKRVLLVDLYIGSPIRSRRHAIDPEPHTKTNPCRLPMCLVVFSQKVRDLVATTFEDHLRRGPKDGDAHGVESFLQAACGARKPPRAGNHAARRVVRSARRVNDPFQYGKPCRVRFVKRDSEPLVPLICFKAVEHSVDIQEQQRVTAFLGMCRVSKIRMLFQPFFGGSTLESAHRNSTNLTTWFVMFFCWFGLCRSNLCA